MSIATLKEVLGRAKRQGYAVGNFDIFNIEMLAGVMAAAERTGSPVILAYGEGFEGHVGVEHFARIMRSMAEEVSVPAVLHCDHAVSLEAIRRMLDCGFTSVMLDASDRPYPVNVEMTQRVVEMANPYGCSVESELGHVSGLGDLFEDDSNVFTDPDVAADFVRQTGIDALAISIGNVHGVYRAEPNIRYDILARIGRKTDIPLVLHGASGISGGDIKRCIALGVTKVNYYTDLCQAAMQAVRENATKHFYDLNEAVKASVAQVAEQLMVLLKG